MVYELWWYGGCAKGASVLQLRFWMGGRDDGWCWSVQIRALCHNEHALTKDNGKNVEVEEKEEH
eukprot:scaffold1967_cov199-Alexandrium_tamarense.AAC.75